MVEQHRVSPNATILRAFLFVDSMTYAIGFNEVLEKRQATYDPNNIITQREVDYGLTYGVSLHSNSLGLTDYTNNTAP